MEVEPLEAYFSCSTLQAFGGLYTLVLVHQDVQHVGPLVRFLPFSPCPQENLIFLVYFEAANLLSSLFYDERTRKKKRKKTERQRIFCLGFTTLTEPKPLFSLLFSLLLDKFQTELGTNINDSCQYHHDERCWYFDDFDEDDEL